jgi:hypothetical protein
MSFLDGIKNFGDKAKGFLKGNRSTLITTAALAYLVYRLNRNVNKGNDIDETPNIDEGVRLQIPPAADNKIPVLYGTAFFGGIITDAQQTNNNQTMTFCLTLSETTGHKLSDSSGSAYTFKDVYLNDQRLVFKADGFTVDYTVDRGGNFDTSLSGLVKVYCYAGGSDTPSIPDGYSNASYPNAYSVMPNWGSSTHQMQNLLFAVVEINYNREKGLTQLGTWNFEIENDMNKPGDVLFDYITNTTYGAGIHEDDINQSDLTALNTFSDTGVAYEDQGTGAETLTDRYQINGLLDTAKTVMENIEKIASATASYLKYDIHEGEWGVVINKSGSSTASFTDDNVLGNVNVASTGLRDLYNKVKVEFPHRDLRDSADFVTIEIPAADRNANEQDNTLQIQYDIINEPIQAQLLGLIELKQSRVNLVIDFETDFTYINLKAGDLIDVTNSRLGFTAKVFRIISIQETQDGDGALTMKIVALEYDANVYSEADLYRYTRSDANGIITIGSIGIPGTPQVTKFESNSRPRVEVETTAPTGLVEAIEFWRTTDVAVSGDENRSYQLIATERPANGGVYTSGTTVVLDYDALAEDEYFFKVRGINSTTTGPFSTPSGLVDFTPEQVPDAIGDDTAVSSTLGNLLGALSIVELLLKLDGLFAGVTGNKSIFQRIKDLIKDATGGAIDIDGGTNAVASAGLATVKDEGTTLTTSATSINFTGDAVTATQANGEVSVQINSSPFNPGGDAPEEGDILVYEDGEWVTKPGLASTVTNCEDDRLPVFTKTIQVWDPETETHVNETIVTGVECPTISTEAAVAPIAELRPTKFLTVTETLPPDRTSWINSTQEGYRPDQAPTTGAYYVKWNTGTAIYSAIELGSGNAKLYTTAGVLKDTKTAAECSIVNNNVLKIPFATRDLKTDYYVLLDEGFVTYGMAHCSGFSGYYVSQEIIIGDWNFNTPRVDADAYTDSDITGTSLASKLNDSNKPQLVGFSFANSFTFSSNPNGYSIHTFIDEMNKQVVPDYEDLEEDDTTTLTFTANLDSPDNVCPDSTLILTFNREVDVTNVGNSINIHDEVDDGIRSTILSSQAKVNPQNRTQVIYTPISNKTLAGAKHFLTLEANIVKTLDSVDCYRSDNKSNDAYTNTNLIFTMNDFDFDRLEANQSSPTANPLQGINPQSEIRIIFTDSILIASSGDIKLYKSGGALHQTFDYNSLYDEEDLPDSKLYELIRLGTTDKTNDTIIINPTVDLDSNSTYYINITSGHVINSHCPTVIYGGINDTTTATFTTDTGPAAPSADVSGGSPSDTGISMTFDRPVVAGSGDMLIKDGNGTVIHRVASTSNGVSITET